MLTVLYGKALLVGASQVHSLNGLRDLATHLSTDLSQEVLFS